MFLRAFRAVPVNKQVDVIKAQDRVQRDGLLGGLLFQTRSYHNPPRFRFLLRYTIKKLLLKPLGQVEQVRDPRLQGLPFVIKQKHIVVTASYPARKLGIKKLQLWTEAKKLCPDL